MKLGRGTANILPDAKIAALIETVIVPRFRQKDYAGGIIQVTQQLADEIHNHADRLWEFVIPTVIWELLGLGIVGLMGICGLLIWRSHQPTPLKMGEQQTRRDVLGQTDIQSWFGDHPPYQLTRLFLAPVLITVTVVLYSLTFIVLIFTRYWGGSLFHCSLLIPIIAALLIFGCLLKFLIDWLIGKEGFLVALRKATQLEREAALEIPVLSAILLFPLLGFSELGWFPIQNIWLWIQRPVQAAGLTVAFSIPLSWKLLQAFEHDSLCYLSQHQAFCCDRDRTALNLLQPNQLEPLLTSEQKTSLAAKTVKIYGWHCPTCNVAINRKTTNLQIARIYRPSQPFGSESSGRSRMSSDSSSASSSTYEPSYYPDTSSSSSDFGGGSSDGGGAGDNW
ncbi:hypothetical protein APA_5068 [Pseudanabaena sp. lw0831]|uniref:TPM domain-containing protein n=1 Tax=Pseudanabaena sp. lw0831 TaxID=1357935 RepID=UPI001915E1A4|nr:TPM domain-containing protein [Pseudanabaena sp. lw0831]GBO56733.1 hypothetical protein APA_5068 [Pseudanabaena sp. lw0831]